MRVLPATFAILLFAITACRNRDAESLPVANASAQVGSQSVKDSVGTLEQEWATAVRTRDSVTLERLLSPDFTLSSAGSTDAPLPRSTWMANTLHRLRVDSVRLSSAQVTVEGDTAKATLNFFWTGQFMSTPPFRDSTVLTDTWVRRAGVWRVHRRVLAD